MPLVISRASGSVSDVELAVFVNRPGGPIREMLRQRGRRVFAAMVPNVPRRTGTLLATARMEEGGVPLRPWVDVTIGRNGVTDYLGYILYGTRPHEIRAIENRPNAHLRFVQHGQIRFAKRVWHPGTQPNDFMTPALQAARG